MSGRLVRLAVLALAVGAVAGCTRGPGTTAALVSTAPSDSSPSAAIGPSATNCVSLYESIDSLDPTLENLRAESRDVIVGTVASEGVPFWDLPTGKGPKPGEQLGEGNEFYILTPYVVTVDQTVTGSRSPGEITIVVEGGEIGCSKLEVLPAVRLTMNARYVLFLGPRAVAGSRAIDLPIAFHAFPIQPDGTVMTPLDGQSRSPRCPRSWRRAPRAPRREG